jgi:hypothetical protein
LAGDEDAERRVEFVEGGSEIADGHVGGGGRGGVRGSRSDRWVTDDATECSKPPLFGKVDCYPT